MSNIVAAWGVNEQTTRCCCIVRLVHVPAPKLRATSAKKLLPPTHDQVPARRDVTDNDKVGAVRTVTRLADDLQHQNQSVCSGYGCKELLTSQLGRQHFLGETHATRAKRIGPSSHARSLGLGRRSTHIPACALSPGCIAIWAETDVRRSPT